MTHHHEQNDVADKYEMARDCYARYLRLSRADISIPATETVRWQLSAARASARERASRGVDA